MNIRLAKPIESEMVFDIRDRAIHASYPKYYTAGALALFLEDENHRYIAEDVEKGIVYVLEVGGELVGTVTVNGNDLQRLFVLPEMQGRGYGKALAEYAVSKAFELSDEVSVDAALSAVGFYEKLGFVYSSFERMTADNGDELCWLVLKKHK